MKKQEALEYIKNEMDYIPYLDITIKNSVIVLISE